MKLCKSILVVEDNEDIREGIVLALEGEGYAIESAADGKEGLEKLRTMPVPSLVLLDLMMPSMSGWEFLDAQKADPTLKDHKIVTVSAVTPNQSLEDPTPLDVHGSVQKPIFLERLWEQVTKFCGPVTETA